MENSDSIDRDSGDSENSTDESNKESEKYLYRVYVNKSMKLATIR